MRPRSMTGFGSGEKAGSDYSWVVEVRTVNHRFLDLRISLPRGFSALEDRIRKLVNRFNDRGRVEINILQQGNGAGGVLLKADMNLAGQYYNCLCRINDELQLGDTVRLNDMLTMRDIIGQQELHPDLDAEWELIEKALSSALEVCCQMREQEGETLRHELIDRLNKFAQVVEMIAEKVPEIVQQRQLDLKVKLDKLAAGVDIDPMRLAQEVTILADKSDVTEEIVRLRSHIDQFAKFMSSSEPVGRRLDFLLQEFLREVNTLASKITNFEIAHCTVEMKNEVEKLREQVQNIE